MPGGGDLLLCSGYIYEPSAGYSLLDDELRDAIVAGTAGATVRTIAGKLEKSGPMDWLQFYRNFVNGLRTSGVQVQALIAPKRNWHAKVAIRFDRGNTPVAAIVGSSNLTGPAYGENRRNWNYESDVTIWLPSVGLQQYFEQPAGDPYEQIAVQLAENVRQPSEAERIKVLLHDIERDSDTFVPLDEYYA
jgi:phosphatidylserine/phosphatidylglycerophosphate/cardiolipin synthase-like enzyme